MSTGDACVGLLGGVGRLPVGGGGVVPNDIIEYRRQRTCQCLLGS